VKRVEVDFSTTVRGGMIRASQHRASETLKQGDRVEAYDPDEEMTFTGVVDHIDADGRIAYLRMEWEENRGVPHNEPGRNLYVSFSADRITTVEPGAETATEIGEGSSVSAPSVGPQPARPFLTPA
jgi:hypothetical protein